MSNTIKIKKYSDIIEEFTLTAVAVIPGALLEMTSAGTAQGHSTAAGDMIPMFALEDELQGGGIKTVIAASQKVQAWIPGRGDQVLAILADGENVAIGDLLESNGAGFLQKYVVDSTGKYVTNNIVGEALEAMDLSGSITDDPVLDDNRHIKVRIF